jgi:hypothetical protein
MTDAEYAPILWLYGLSVGVSIGAALTALLNIWFAVGVCCVVVSAASWAELIQRRGWGFLTGWLP